MAERGQPAPAGPAADRARLADRCASAAVAVAGMSVSGAPGRWGRRVGGVLVTSLGVPTVWGLRAHLLAGVPPQDQVDAVVAALTAAHPTRWSLVVRARDAAHPVLARYGLGRYEDQPVLALPSVLASGLDAQLPGRLHVGPARDRAEFVTAYGGWMDDAPLAERLVAAADLADPAWLHVVGRWDEVPVAAAIVRRAERTGYLSGIGVLAELRGRGIGAALTTWAAREAAAGTDLVWMHATAEGAGLYRRLGFTTVDSHVLLAPPQP